MDLLRNPSEVASLRVVNISVCLQGVDDPAAAVLKSEFVYVLSGSNWVIHEDKNDLEKICSKSKAFIIIETQPRITEASTLMIALWISTYQ
jgi:hypothetical protein